MSGFLSPLLLLGLSSAPAAPQQPGGLIGSISMRPVLDGAIDTRATLAGSVTTRT